MAENSPGVFVPDNIRQLCRIASTRANLSLRIISFWVCKSIRAATSRSIPSGSRLSIRDSMSEVGCERPGPSANRNVFPGTSGPGRWQTSDLRTPAPRFAGQVPNWRGFLSRVCNQLYPVSVRIVNHCMRCLSVGIRGSDLTCHQSGSVLPKPGNDLAPHRLPRDKRPARAWYTILFL